MLVDELNIIKEVVVILRGAGLSKADIPLWLGLQSLDPVAYRVLLEYLRTSTKKEIKDLNLLLKQKINILKSGDKAAWRSLVIQEKENIIK